jgi:hypothetical protein
MLGVLAIVAGVVSNWFEIPKFAKDGVDRPERLLFVGAALVLIAHGFKQLKKAQLIKDRQKEMSTSTPQPNESSEVK